MMQALRFSRFMARCRCQQAVFQRRTFLAPTAVLRADLVQDLYLKELKNYKPTPLKASDADAHVHKFNIPSSPPSPEEADIVKDLDVYAEQTVEVEGQAAAGQEVTEEDWFEQEDEQEEAHH